MPHRVRLGRSELMVSPVCFGTFQATPRRWGNVPDEQLIAAMRRGCELGVNFFDTADLYGPWRGEELLGEALAPFPREDLVVATKAYNHFTVTPPPLDMSNRYPDTSGDYLREACEASLRRLKMDYVDLFLCHAFDPLAHPEDTTAALEDLKRAGKVRHYGVSNYTVEQTRMARRYGDYVATQPRYNLLSRDIEKDLLPYCLAEDIGVFSYGSLARGLLAGKYTGDETFPDGDTRRTNPAFQGEAFRRTCEQTRGLIPLAEEHGVTVPQLVLAATLMHPALHSVIVGIKTPEQIEDVARAMDLTLTRQDYYEVRSVLGGW